MESAAQNITVRISRRDPASDARSEWHEYHVPLHRARRVLDVLEYIQEELDPTLGFRPHLCRDLCCGACWVRLNGRDRMACATPLDVKGGETITLEPASTHALIRDLVVDFSHPLEGVKRQGK